MGDQSIPPGGQYRKVQDLEERIPSSLSWRSAIEYPEAAIGRLEDLGEDCSVGRRNSAVEVNGPVRPDSGELLAINVTGENLGSPLRHCQAERSGQHHPLHS